MKNKIHEFRRKLGLTQRQLAAAVATSQQQIQRIESGVQSARFDLAVRICTALGATMEQVFPATRASLKKISAKGKTIKDLRSDKKAAEELSNAGIDTEYEHWTLKFMLRNGYEGFHRISGGEKNRLWSAVQRVDGFDRFVVYDTNQDRIALNLEHLIFTQFLFDAFSGDASEAEANESVKFYTVAKRDPLEFSVEPDDVDLSEEPDSEESVQLQDLFFTAELSCDDDDVVSLCDEDGETAFFRLKDVAMISVPLNRVEPALFQSEMEGDDEDENEEFSEADKAH